MNTRKSKLWIYCECGDACCHERKHMSLGLAENVCGIFGQSFITNTCKKGPEPNWKLIKKGMGYKVYAIR